MSSYDPVTPYATGDAAASPAAIIDSIAAWIDNDPLADLVAAFGGTVTTGALEDRLATLETFSAEHWDFRGGQERNLVTAAEFDADIAELVLDAAEALGLRTTTRPRATAYDHVLVLGGLVRACLLRTCHAAELVGGPGAAAVGDVTGLTAHRPLKGDEIELLAQVGLPELPDEAAVMDAGLVTAFDLALIPSTESAQQSEDEFGGSLVRRWAPPGLPEVRLVVAPSPEPITRRANSADTYTWWAENVANLGAGSSVLLVTSSIYVPYQNSGAVERLGLPYGATVETVGLDFSREDHGPLRQPFGPQQYLQEIRSAVRGARTLHNRAVEASYREAGTGTPARGVAVSAPPWPVPPRPKEGGDSTKSESDATQKAVTPRHSGPGPCSGCDIDPGNRHTPSCSTLPASS